MILLYAKCVHLLNRSIIAWPCVCLGCYCECILLLLLLEEEEESSFVYEGCYVGIYTSHQTVVFLDAFKSISDFKIEETAVYNERKV